MLKSPRLSTPAHGGTMSLQQFMHTILVASPFRLDDTGSLEVLFKEVHPGAWRVLEEERGLLHLKEATQIHLIGFNADPGTIEPANEWILWNRYRPITPSELVGLYISNMGNQFFQDPVVASGLQNPQAHLFFHDGGGKEPLRRLCGSTNGSAFTKAYRFGAVRVP